MNSGSYQLAFLPNTRRGLAEPAAQPVEQRGLSAHQPHLFRSFLIGGFESSSHRREGGRQLDLIAATRHDEHAFDDYRLLRAHGISTVRDGLRWHLIETEPGRYDWSSFLPMLRAAALVHLAAGSRDRSSPELLSVHPGTA